MTRSVFCWPSKRVVDGGEEEVSGYLREGGRDDVGSGRLYHDVRATAHSSCVPVNNASASPWTGQDVVARTVTMLVTFRPFRYNYFCARVRGMLAEAENA